MEVGVHGASPARWGANTEELSRCQKSLPGEEASGPPGGEGAGRRPCVLIALRCVRGALLVTAPEQLVSPPSLVRVRVCVSFVLSPFGGLLLPSQS